MANPTVTASENVENTVLPKVNNFQYLFLILAKGKPDLHQTQVKFNRIQ